MDVMEVTEFGPPNVFAKVERPDLTPDPGEVVVDVAAVHVLWVETAVRRGDGRGWFPLEPPYVPGTGVAGTVRAAGAGVRFSAGQRVVAHTGLDGGYATQVRVGVDRVVAVPDEVGLTDAAALVHDLPTALSLFDRLAVGADDSVLVVGASGGLGLTSVQLARRRGARVVALAREPAKITRIRALGPDAVVDTAQPGWPDEVRRALPDGADVVLDNVGGVIGAAAVPLLADDGRWSAHGTPGGGFSTIDPAEVTARRLTVFGIGDVQFPPAERTRLLAAGLDAAARGEVVPVVGQTFPLARAADAHAAIEARTVFGATLLLP